MKECKSKQTNFKTKKAGKKKRKMKHQKGGSRKQRLKSMVVETSQNISQ